MIGDEASPHLYLRPALRDSVLDEKVGKLIELGESKQLDKPAE